MMTKSETDESKIAPCVKGKPNFESSAYDFTNILQSGSKQQIDKKAATTKNAVSCTNTRAFYTSNRNTTIGQQSNYGSRSMNQVIKRPMTAFYSRTNPTNAVSMSISTKWTMPHVESRESCRDSLQNERT